MSNTTTTISALSLLDQQIRRDIFRPLQSDPEGAANLALAYPVYTNKIGTATFRAYRASRPHHLRYFLSDLVACPPLARFVEAICLAAPLDDQAQSGSWELMFALVQQQPQSLPLIFPAGVPAAASLSDFFAKYQLTLVNGAVRGLEHVPLAFYYGLPTLMTHEGPHDDSNPAHKAMLEESSKDANKTWRPSEDDMKKKILEELDPDNTIPTDISFDEVEKLLPSLLSKAKHPAPISTS
ncbi:hypothetical protein CC86DRAFT_400644 [Ophiobolus disseminans]|uniref:Uncharacterized protein n=1 Tax=Ophiobolus disseminans TaxID=1469910 RepID=A0A6A7AEY0_9PLEO|nr:hypothetical protein CC86DRAFT_400644 [Ophiobolus disseminans]